MLRASPTSVRAPLAVPKNFAGPTVGTEIHARERHRRGDRLGELVAASSGLPPEGIQKRRLWIRLLIGLCPLALERSALQAQYLSSL